MPQVSCDRLAVEPGSSHFDTASSSWSVGCESLEIVADFEARRLADRLVILGEDICSHADGVTGSNV